MPYRFMVFQKYNYTLDRYKNERYNLRRVSVTADLVSQFTQKLKMQFLVQTDILLYYLSLIYPSNSMLEGIWYPTIGCYNRKVENSSKAHFKEIFLIRSKCCLGVNNVTQFKELLDGVKSEQINNAYYHIPFIKQGLMYDKVCTME